MSEYGKAILRYEVARQSANELEEKRRFLVSSCLNNTDPWNQTNCFVLAHETMLEANVGGDIYGHVRYEVVFESYEFVGGLSACDNCREAFKIKYGELAEARKEFGAAKRSLAAIGKQLIKENKS